MWPNPQFPADLITFTEKILNRKLDFLCSAGAPARCNNLLLWVIKSILVIMYLLLKLKQFFKRQPTWTWNPSHGPAQGNLQFSMKPLHSFSQSTSVLGKQANSSHGVSIVHWVPWLSYSGKPKTCPL